MAFKKQRMGRKKVCYFTKNDIKTIDYKDVEQLKRFVSANGKIHDIFFHLLGMFYQNCSRLQLKISNSQNDEYRFHIEIQDLT